MEDRYMFLLPIACSMGVLGIIVNNLNLREVNVVNKEPTVAFRYVFKIYALHKKNLLYD